jgi:hypothetical protein
MLINKIKHLDAVSVDQLKKHPEAHLLIDKNDQSLIGDSVQANGIYQPLIVIADEKKDDYLIIDGCNRFDAGVAAKQVVFDCELVDCDDVSGFIVDNLISRRKGTVSQRILAYLERHKLKVLQTSENHGGRSKNLINSRNDHDVNYEEFKSQPELNS